MIKNDRAGNPSVGVPNPSLKGVKSLGGDCGCMLNTEFTEVFKLVVRKNLKSADTCAQIPSVFRVLRCLEHH